MVERENSNQHATDAFHKNSSFPAIIQRANVSQRDNQE